MMDKNQVGKFSKAEKQLIRDTFGGEGESVLYEVRNILLQFPNKEIPKLGADILEILKKIILSDLREDVPLGEQSDFYFLLPHIRELPPEVVALQIEAQDQAIDYLRQRLVVLSGGELTQETVLKDFKNKLDKTDNERYIGMLVYQLLMNNYIDSCLMSLKAIANTVEETPEEEAKRIIANSSK